MLEFVCIAMPGALTVFLLEKLLKKEMRLHDQIGTAILNIFLINFLVLAYLTYARSGGNFTLYFEPDRIRADIALKYMLLSCGVGAVLTVGEAFFLKNGEVHTEKENPEA